MKKKKTKKKKSTAFKVTVPVHEFLINLFSTLHDEGVQFIGTDGKRIDPKKVIEYRNEDTGETLYNKNCVKVVTCKEVKDEKPNNTNRTSGKKANGKKII